MSAAVWISLGSLGVAAWAAYNTDQQRRRQDERDRLEDERRAEEQRIDVRVTFEEAWSPPPYGHVGHRPEELFLELTVVATNHGRRPVHVAVLGFEQPPEVSHGRWGFDDRREGNVRELAPFGGTARLVYAHDTSDLQAFATGVCGYAELTEPPGRVYSAELFVPSRPPV